MGKVNAWRSEREQQHFDAGYDAGYKGAPWLDIGAASFERDAYKSGYESGHSAWADEMRAQVRA